MQPAINPQLSRISQFALETRFEDLPLSTVNRVQDLILDLIGVSAAARDITASSIARATAVRMFNTIRPEDSARMLFDGQTASRAGAAYAGATQIDSLDAHDGFSEAKGHAGCGLLPAVLAFIDREPDFKGRDFLTAMVIGYELASRAGVALHATVPDYHTSGAWVAPAVAALGVRIQGGNSETLRQALGIAEYHGPRSQMMREIDNPTMLHDGSGWGSMVGVTSAELAMAGFEGAPAVTFERADAASYWDDLGSTWLTEQQNIKLFPVCRWAHAPIQAAFELREQHNLQVEDITGIEVHSFHEAVRLASDIPSSTSKAQYSIHYPIAAALKFGRLGVREISGETFGDPDLARLISLTTAVECEHCNTNFPADRLGRTVIKTRDGQTFDSGIVRAPGERVNPVGRDGIVDKFYALTDAKLLRSQGNRIEEAVFGLSAEDAAISTLQECLFNVLDA
jgi:2-methylcitrate dehydratase PrpD